MDYFVRMRCLGRTLRVVVALEFLANAAAEVDPSRPEVDLTDQFRRG
jgi:hypothetical protein